MSDDHLRAQAAHQLFVAAGRVPIVKRGDTKPFSTCLGCGRVDGESCKRPCWVYDLDVARGQVAWAFDGDAEFTSAGEKP